MGSARFEPISTNHGMLLAAAIVGGCASGARPTSWLSTLTKTPLAFVTLGSSVSDPTMSNVVRFYYDIVSPWSYVSFHVIRRYRAVWDMRVDWHPISLAYVMKHSGNRPPMMVPNKGRMQAQEVGQAKKMFNGEWIISIVLSKYSRNGQFPWSSRQPSPLTPCRRRLSCEACKIKVPKCSKVSRRHSTAMRGAMERHFPLRKISARWPVHFLGRTSRFSTSWSRNAEPKSRVSALATRRRHLFRMRDASVPRTCCPALRSTDHAAG